MKLLTERYKSQIAGVISCCDRIVFQGTVPGWCFAQVMTSFLLAKKFKSIDYPQFARVLKDEVQESTKGLAQENGNESSSSAIPRKFGKKAKLKNHRPMR